MIGIDDHRSMPLGLEPHISIYDTRRYSLYLYSALIGVQRHSRYYLDALSLDE